MAARDLVTGVLGPAGLSAAVIGERPGVPALVRGRPAIDGSVGGPVGDILRGRAVQKSGPSRRRRFWRQRWPRADMRGATVGVINARSPREPVAVIARRHERRER